MTSLWLMIVWMYGPFDSARIGAILPMRAQKECEQYREAMTSKKGTIPNAKEVIECRDIIKNPLTLLTADPR